MDETSDSEFEYLREKFSTAKFAKVSRSIKKIKNEQNK
jgi:hypothetical protein